MKKLKRFFVALMAIFTLAIMTGCSTSFCSSDDVTAIKQGLLTQIENDTGTGDYARPNTEALKKAGITVEYLVKQGVEGTSPDLVITWEYLGTLEAEKATAVKNAYVDYVYKTYHPKACLVDEDHIDQNSGALITKKTFKFATKQGLLEIIAWPVSWLFINGAKLLGGGTVSGGSICASIIIVTFIIRAIIFACTIKSSRQQQVMQELQGEMNAIQAKYADKKDPESKQKMQMETMALYKKHGVKPMASLINPIITLPIFIAVYSAVKDTMIIFEQELAGLSLGAKLGNSIIHGKWLAIVIFIIMAASQFVTMKLPQWLAKKKAKSYNKEKQKGGMQQNMMTYIFLIMIIVIAWMLPLAMSIYWVASSLFSIIQTFLLQIPSKKKKNQKPIEVKGVRGYHNV